MENVPDLALCGAKCANVFKLNEFQFWDRISAAFIELNWNPRDFFCNFHSNRIKSSITSMKSIIYHLYIYTIYTYIHPLLILRLSYYTKTPTTIHQPLQFSDAPFNCFHYLQWIPAWILNSLSDSLWVLSCLCLSAHVTWFSSLIFARHSTRRCSLLFLFKLDLPRIELIFLLHVIILMMSLESVGSNVFVQTILLAHNLFTKCAS